ncbi:unnamed protein product [Urochloa decumbens]|uniref:C2H2-type domain-containing protein n=1 Tax=Urochloa decumbens TaxID=240449 RepID=A0ABC9C1A0_9POAL
MEFRYRAGDERRSRSHSPPPPSSSPPAAASTSDSGSADTHGGGGGPAVAPRQQSPAAPPPAVAATDSADEMRRQAEKAKIRERILREEAEHLELELEVRQEIREQLLRLSWSALGRSAAGSGPLVVAPPPARIISGNASLPVAAHEALPKANTVPTSPAKRKSPDQAAVSTVSAATSCKKQKVTLSCTVCGISVKSEKAMKDHVNGKLHKRKATALLELPKPTTEQEAAAGKEAGVEALAPSGDYMPTKFMMLMNEETLNEVMQMDGYLLCEVCNVKTADRVTMLCHLQGRKHISKGQRKGQASSKPPDEAAKKGTKGVSVPEVSTSAFASAGPETLVPEVYGMPHTVRRLEGFFLCELCNKKALSMSGMQQHLSGKKHKNKANASPDVSVNASTCRKDTAKAQPMDADTAVIAGMAVQVEAPLTQLLEAIVADDSVPQKITAASAKEDVTTGDRTKSHGDMKASASAAEAQDNNVCDSDSLTMEVDNVHHPLQRVDGFLVCPCCNAKAPSEIIMRSHLAGKKHKHKRTLAARVNMKGVSVLVTVADEVQGNSSKSPEANVEEESAPIVVRHANNASAMVPMEVDTQSEVKPDTCIEPAEDGEIIEVQSNSSKSVKQHEGAKSVLALAAPQAKNAAPKAPMDEDGLAELAAHVEPAEDGEIARLQSNGKKSDKADEETESAQSLVAPQVKNADTMAPLEVEGPAEFQRVAHVELTDQDGEITEEAGAEPVADKANGYVTTQTKDSMETNDTAAPGKPIKIQVEGKLFTVLQQENGRLSCGTCGVHGCSKDSMILHLYTRTHWDKANRIQKKEATAAVVNKDGCGGSAAGAGSGGALMTTV